MELPLWNDAGVFQGKLHLYFENEHRANEAVDSTVWWTRLPDTFLDGAKSVTVRELEKSVMVAGTDFSWVVNCCVPIVDMSYYLRCLVTYANSLGISFQASASWLRTKDIEEVSRAWAQGLVIACGGWTPKLLGSNDSELVGLRGQLVLATPPEDLRARREVHLVHMPDRSRPVYSVSTSSGDTWIGGTAMPEDFVDGGHRPQYQLDEESRMLIEAEELIDCRLPKTATPENTRIGIRPYRSSVRVELLQSSNFHAPTVVNYGHGGAGVSLSWGCANEAIAVLEDAEHAEMVAADEVHFG
ncbi:MAG: FAD-dependent oxidoreductase [Leptolyngbyaceae cyanobacterium]